MKKLEFRTDILPLKDGLYRLALRITLNREEAEDVVQETMIKLWNQHERWQELESIEAYANTICRNIALDHIRRKDNRMVSLEEERPSEQSTDPYHQMWQQEQIQMIRQIMASLPEKQSTCMHLRDFEGKSYQEIATILQITEDQVKVNIFRARKAIKQRIDNNA